MKTTIQNLIFLAVLGAAGYFAYQYFFGSSQQGSSSTVSTFNMYSLPEKCQESGDRLKNAFNRHAKGEIRKVQLNGYTSNLRECLRREGFTTDEVNDTVDQIKKSR